MTNYKALMITVLSIVWLSELPGQPPSEEIKYWSSFLPSKTLSQIAEALDVSSTPKWPEVGSSFFIGKLTGEPRSTGEAALELVRLLHRRLILEFKYEPLDDPFLEISNYIAISNALDRAGGYSNDLLADSFRRLVVFKASKMLIEGDVSSSNVSELIDALVVPQVRFKDQILKYYSQDKALEKALDQVERMPEDGNYYVALSAAGFEHLAFPDIAFSTLLEEPSSIGLAIRMCSTQGLYKVQFMGLVKFLELGGEYDELDLADITAFKKRMGNVVDDFQLPVFDVRSLSVSDVKALPQIHSEKSAMESFIRIALE